jgi:hypothetical protein
MASLSASCKASLRLAHFTPIFALLLPSTRVSGLFSPSIRSFALLNPPCRPTLPSATPLPPSAPSPVPPTPLPRYFDTRHANPSALHHGTPPDVSSLFSSRSLLKSRLAESAPFCRPSVPSTPPLLFVCDPCPKRPLGPPCESPVKTPPAGSTSSILTAGTPSAFRTASATLRATRRHATETENALIHLSA